MTIILLGAGIWFVSAVIIGLIVGRALRDLSRNDMSRPRRRT